MKKTVTLTLVFRGKGEELYRKYEPIIKKAQKAYFVSASGKVIPADSLNAKKVKDLDRSA